MVVGKLVKTGKPCCDVTLSGSLFHSNGAVMAKPPLTMALTMTD